MMPEMELVNDIKELIHNIASHVEMYNHHTSLHNLPHQLLWSQYFLIAAYIIQRCSKWQPHHIVQLASL